MEFEVGANLAGLLATTPWFTLAALALWPDKGIVALWIRGSQAIRQSEIEREKIRDELKLKGPRSTMQERLPPPDGESK